MKLYGGTKKQRRLLAYRLADIAVTTGIMLGMIVAVSALARLLARALGVG